MVEIWFGIVKSKVLGESFSSAQAVHAALADFARQWNEVLARPFKWDYTGEGLQAKAVQRFTQMLLTDAKRIELRTLTKLMRLVVNLHNDYNSVIGADTWAIFLHASREALGQIDDLIEQEPGPRRKRNARKALELLLQTLPIYNEATTDPPLEKAA